MKDARPKGCPNRCAFGDDCCHVGDGFAGCGGAGHVVGGVFHGCIAPVDQNKSEQITYRIQSLNA